MYLFSFLFTDKAHIHLGHTTNFLPMSMLKVNFPLGDLCPDTLAISSSTEQSLGSEGGTYPQCCQPERLLCWTHHPEDPAGIQSYLLPASGAAVEENTHRQQFRSELLQN